MRESSGGDRRAFLRRSAILGAGAFGTATLAAEAEAALAAPIGTSGPGWSAERRLHELGIRLPAADAEAQTPMLVPAVRTGNLVFMSGHGPRGEGGYITGKVGADLTEEQGNAAARAAAETMLAALRTYLEGDLDRVERVVKVLGMVNATPEFTRQPQVINGFSELMIEVFGDAGRSARSAIGVGSLPGNWAVEVEAIFELKA